MAYTEINCKKCNKIFKAENKAINRGWGKFCSKSCSISYNNKLKAVEKINNTECSWCKKSFHRRPSKPKSKSGLYFCCRNHKDKAQRLDGLEDFTLDHYGKGNGSWSYRERALEHYGSICNRCQYNKNEAILEVHHTNRNRSENLLNNLEVLCKNCHYEEHLEDKAKRIQDRLIAGDYNFKIDWPPLDQLKDMVIFSSYDKVSIKLGVSNTAVKTHIWVRDLEFKENYKKLKKARKQSNPAP